MKPFEKGAAARAVENKPQRYDVIAVDFDGTLCEDRFPDIGAPKPVVIEFVKHHAARGTKIVLHTCRENLPQRAALDEAVEFCAAHEIPLYAVNENPSNPFPELYGTGPGRKVYADLYIDDKAVNVANMELVADMWETTPARNNAIQNFLQKLLKR